MAGFHIDDLKLALQYDLITHIITADDNVDDSEDRLLGAVCPPERMRAAGFHDDAWQLTERLAEAVREARRVLPHLDLEEKRVILDSLVNACVVDGHLDPRETDELRHGAKVLGLTDAQFDALLDDHPAVATIDPGNPE